MVQPLWKTGCQILKNFKSEMNILCNNSTSMYIPKRIESRVSRYLYTHIHSSKIIIAKMQKQLKCPSAGEWISKTCHIHVVQHSLALKRRKFWFHLQKILSGQNIETECRMVDAREQRKGEWKLFSDGYRASALRDEELWRWTVVTVVPPLYYML